MRKKPKDMLTAIVPPEKGRKGGEERERTRSGQAKTETKATGKGEEPQTTVKAKEKGT